MMQPSPTTRHIAHVLRNTLRRLEQDGAFRHSDPAFIHLKRRLVLAIAELEMQRSLYPDHDKPVVVLRVRRRPQPDSESEAGLCLTER
jgi:hypothetical protein